jgi:bidirectional [NiFe] hydrogenase diaphorase subunit
MAVRFKINDVEVTAPEGQSLLEAARSSGFSIPSLCHHQAVAPIGACRVCLVEVRSEKNSRLTTSCDLPVQEGLDVITDSALVRSMRAVNLELLLARAPGAERVRELAAEYGVVHPRFPVKEDPYLPNCILCELCVRVCEQLGHHALTTEHRGDRKRVGLPFNKPSATCVGCGSCAAVCPTRCIFMRDTPISRTIWGQTFDFVLCKVCNAPVITEKHRAHAIATKGLLEDYYDVCESCKQAATSQRFGALAWW